MSDDPIRAALEATRDVRMLNLGVQIGLQTARGILLKHRVVVCAGMEIDELAERALTEALQCPSSSGRIGRPASGRSPAPSEDRNA